MRSFDDQHDWPVVPPQPLRAGGAGSAGAGANASGVVGVATDGIVAPGGGGGEAGGGGYGGATAAAASDGRAVAVREAATWEEVGSRMTWRVRMSPL